VLLKPLKPIELSYWQRYLETLPEDARPGDALVEAGYCGNREITDELLALYLAGKKTAGSGLVQDYQTAGDPLPSPGRFWIILDSNGNPRCLVKTIRVVFNRFKDIPDEIALAEGEGDCSVGHWKGVHGELYAPYLSQWGIPDLDEAEVVTEFFEVVFK
jgi:uncharacterized protein YhfF